MKKKVSLPIKVKKTGVMKNYIISVLIIILLGVICPACQKHTTIVLFHINDIHAKIDNFAKIAWLLNQERAQHDNVFLLVGGDNFSGNPVVDQYDPRGEEIHLNKYDQAMIATGIYAGRQVSGTSTPEQSYGWREHSARRVSNVLRPHLRDVLIEQGFELK